MGVKMPYYREPGYDSIVELGLYVADSVKDDLALVSLGNVAGAVYRGAVGPLREDMDANGPDHLIEWLDGSDLDPDKVWAEAAADAGEPIYQVAVYLLFVLVKEPDTADGIGESYWECVGEIDQTKLGATLK